MVRRKPSSAAKEGQQRRQLRQQQQQQAGFPSGTKGKAGAADPGEDALAGFGDPPEAPGGPGLSAAEQQRLDRISLALETRLAALLGDEGDDGGGGATAAAAAVAVGQLQLGELEEWWDGEEAEAEVEGQEGAAEGAAKEAQRAQQQQAEQPAASGRSGKRGRRGAGKDKPPESTVPDELLPKVAVVGRPNVGKSALFNRIVGEQVAIVYDYPGVTRDRLYTRGWWGGREFLLVDTGGLMSEAAKLPREQQGAAMTNISAAGLPTAIERQAAAAVEESDALILVVDGQLGCNAADEEILAWLRRTHPDKPVVLAVNKCDNVAKADIQASEFWGTGLEPVAVSAISGSGTGDLMDRLVQALPSKEEEDEEAATTGGPEQVAMAIVGRPNVGKSSLLNAIVGKERSIVSSMAGTTRDAIDTDVTTPDGRSFKLVDTAGVRKRTAVAGSKDGAESLSVERAFRAVRRCEVAVLVIDASEGITQQDFRLSEYVAAEGRACVVVVNKWDTVKVKTDRSIKEYEDNVRAELRPVEWANIVFTSATTGQRVKRVLDAATASAEEHRRRVSTATLNLVLQDAVGWRAPPSTGSGKRGRIYYATQAGIKPPSFVLFVNDPSLFPDDYKKYIERQLRENIGFPGTPLRLFWRGKQGGWGRTVDTK
ncbi:hypothetical protein N2152v2_000102 [Parachlorella kessleri]